MTRCRQNTSVSRTQLHAEITRLTRALAAARLESANRLAAIRAALAAADDGESGPITFLREHLADEETCTPHSRSGQ